MQQKIKLYLLSNFFSHGPSLNEENEHSDWKVIQSIIKCEEKVLIIDYAKIMVKKKKKSLFS